MKYLFLLVLLLVPLVSADAYLSVPPTGSFKMINMTGGNVTAQFTNDFVEFVAGSGVTISPNYTLNEITFSASPGGLSSIHQIGNVSSSGCVLNEILKVNSTGYFDCSADQTGGSIALDDLTDVIITTPAYLSTLFYDGANWIDKIFTINTTTCDSGKFVSAVNNQTGSVTCTTPAGSGNATSLDDLGDVVLTTPAYPSVLFYNGLQWIDKIFSVNNQTVANDFQIVGINNQTGVITRNQFSVNTLTCSGNDKVSAINNVTGVVTCTTDQTGGGTNALLDGSVHSDTVAQTVSRGSIIYGDSTPKWNELTIGGASTYLKSDGTDVSWASVSASAPRGGYLMAHWSMSQTKSNIGTSFVNVYAQTNSNGKAVFIDTDTFTSVRLHIQWNKVGAGTQTCQVLNGATVLVSTDVVSGSNDSGFDAIPAGLLNAENQFSLQCKSTTGTDDPIFENAAIWMK